MSKYKSEDVERLIDSMENLLDDMGLTTLTVNELSKAKARVAFEPFAKEFRKLFICNLSDAKVLIKEQDEWSREI